jgi:hypothetical protein
VGIAFSLLDAQVNVLEKDNTTRCRVKRHRISMTSHEHARSTETRPANVICAQEAFQAENGDKLYSKVLKKS